MKSDASRSLPGDREVRAEAIRLRAVVRVADPGGRVVVERRRSVSTEGGDDAGEDHDQPVAAGVDDPGLAQDRQEVGRPLDRLLPRLDGAREDRGDRVLLDVDRRVDRQPGLRRVGQVAGDPVGHLPHDRQDRPLGRRPDRRVRPVGRPCHRRADQDRVDQLARPADELLGGPADQLGQDHAAVAASPQERCPGDRVDDLVASDLVDRPVTVARQAVELVEHGPQREDHVVAGVTVGDRKHVEIVDLFAAGLQMCQRTGDHRAKANEVGVGHDPRAVVRPPW